MGWLCAAALLAFCPATGAAAAIQIVSAGDEFAAAHPGRHAKATATKASGEDFRTTMDRVFGAGRWRQTSGYRSQAQEDALRRQGAGTVAPGRVSYHSIGGADSPGAYDAVVDRMPLGAAAAKLKSAGGGFSRVLAEGAHGPQGAHLHIELARTAPAAAAPEAVTDDAVYRREARGRRRSLLTQASSAGAALN
ncbi:hypothetical protein [Phenylobacterium sp.]|uniref:hypothetical protein n=1 Tax=Phenylobacterium sp. TaxID=1871053 RepID=UPI003566E7D8